MPDKSDTDPRPDDPRKIAEHLVAEHGFDGAVKMAVAGTTEAQRDDDNYGLSVWREVKRILREQEPTADLS